MATVATRQRQRHDSTARMEITAQFYSLPIGTGPYQVVRNTQTQLKIRAYDDYFGFRALIDEVNIWVLPEISEELVHAGVQLQSDETGKDELESRLEEGCYFMLFDQRSAITSDPQCVNGCVRSSTLSRC